MLGGRTNFHKFDRVVHNCKLFYISVIIVNFDIFKTTYETCLLDFNSYTRLLRRLIRIFYNSRLM